MSTGRKKAVDNDHRGRLFLLPSIYSLFAAVCCAGQSFYWPPFFYISGRRGAALKIDLAPDDAATERSDDSEQSVTTTETIPCKSAHFRVSRLG